MKGLEALEALKIDIIDRSLLFSDEKINIIEKELKALEILKPLLWVADYKGTYYLVINEEGIEIDREKYDLFEEVLR